MTTISNDPDERALRKQALIADDERFKEAMLAAHPDLAVGTATPDPLSRPVAVTPSGFSSSLVGSSGAMCVEN